MPPFKVRTFAANGVLTGVQTILAGSIDSAAEQACGKGLLRDIRDGELVAIVEDEKRHEKVAFYRRSSPRVRS
jgi:hypothetical protein